MSVSIAIILVETESADNIGAAARAMKNMGLSNLRLVRPPAGWKIKGRKLAMSARNVLESAQVFPDLESAAGDLHLLIGTTRRIGFKRGMWIPFDQAVKKISKISAARSIGILFGKESKGLDNKSLAHCDWVTTIPAHPEYASINLAQAVMVVAFSLFNLRAERCSLAWSREALLFSTGSNNKVNFLSKGEIQEVLNRIRPALKVLGYENEGAGVLDRILATFQRMMKRGGLLESEAQMLKGVSRRIVEKMEKAVIQSRYEPRKVETRTS